MAEYEVKPESFFITRIGARIKLKTPPTATHPNGMKEDALVRNDDDARKMCMAQNAQGFQYEDINFNG